jgi:hypothetical protein
MNRRDVWLRYNPKGPLWEVEARQSGRSAVGEYATEQEARTMLAELTTSGPGTWRRLGA